MMLLGQFERERLTNAHVEFSRLEIKKRGLEEQIKLAQLTYDIAKEDYDRIFNVKIEKYSYEG